MEILNKTVGNDLLNIITSTRANFVYDERQSIFHFKTDMSQDELEFYVDLVENKTTGFKYVLVPAPENIATNLPAEHKHYLMLIDQPDIDDYCDTETIAYETVETTLKQKPEDVCVMTLDEILDKISLSGINSLTTNERNKLDEYSKQV